MYGGAVDIPPQGNFSIPRPAGTIATGDASGDASASAQGSGAPGSAPSAQGSTRRGTIKKAGSRESPLGRLTVHKRNAIGTSKYQTNCYKLRMSGKWYIYIIWYNYAPALCISGKIWWRFIGWGRWRFTTFLLFHEKRGKKTLCTLMCTRVGRIMITFINHIQHHTGKVFPIQTRENNSW